MSDDSDDNPFDESFSSSDDEALFTFQKKKFTKNKTVDQECSSPSPRKKGRKSADSTDDALSKLEHRRQHKPRRPSLHNEDSDDEEGVTPGKENSSNGVTTSQQVVDLLDDSSDEEDASATARRPPRGAPVASLARNGAALKACSQLQKARVAAHHLQQAQKYHAEDIYVPVETPAPIAAASPMLISAPAAPAPTNLGPTLHIKLRTTQVVNGQRSKEASEESMPIRQQEPFSRLMERYTSHHSLDTASSRITFSFDGEKVNMTRTPASYDMEDDDLVDVLVQTLAMPTSSSSSSASLGPHLDLKLRTSGGESDSLSIRSKEPLQKLLDKYKTHKKLGARAKVHFTFDGESMNMTRTPQSYDMESDDIIDVTVRN